MIRPSLALLLLVLRSPVLAQTVPESQDTVPVPLAPLVVTASKTPVRADRVGFAFTILSSSILRREHVTTAADALRLVPGAFLDEATGPGGPTIVRLRGGEEVFTQVLMDGVQVNENGGFFDMLGLPLGSISRVEVARGPQSAVYGSSAVSGVVNFLTPAGDRGPAQLHLLAEGGSATEHGGGWLGQARVGGGVGSLLYSAGFTSSYERGVFALPHNTRSKDGVLRLDLAPSDRFNLTGIARMITVSSHLPVRDPGAIRVPLDPNARDDRDRVITSLVADFQPSRAWSHRLRLSRYDEDFLYEDQRDGLEIPENAGFFVFDASFQFRNELVRSTAEYGGVVRFGRPGSLATDLSYGAQWEQESLESRTTGDFEDQLSLERESLAGYGEVRLDPTSRVSLMAGIRVERYQGLEAEWTPRGSLVWHADPDWLTVRAAAGRAYKAPNLQQQYVDNPFIVANPSLAPERSNSIEAGVDVRTTDGRLTLSATVFSQRFLDLIRTVAVSGSTKQTNRNIGSSSARGVEWDTTLRMAPAWSLEGNGAWVRTEVLGNDGLNPAEYPGGEPLPFRPELVAGAALVWNPADAPVSGLIRARWVGGQPVLTERFSGRRQGLDGYLLFSATGEWRAHEAIRFFVRANNLLNTSYETAFDRRGIPLTMRAGAEVDLR